MNARAIYRPSSAAGDISTGKIALTHACGQSGGYHHFPAPVARQCSDTLDGTPRALSLVATASRPARRAGHQGWTICLLRLALPVGGAAARHGSSCRFTGDLGRLANDARCWATFNASAVAPIVFVDATSVPTTSSDAS